MLVKEQTPPPASLTVEDRETPRAPSAPGVGPQLEGKRKMTGRNILTATLADGRRGTLLRTATLLILSFAVAMTLASVAMGQETSENQPVAETIDETRASGPITVVVDNRNWSDMKVYAIADGLRYRLGTAYTMTPAEFELPRHLQADVRGLELVALPIGGNRLHRSGNLLVTPGDVVGWTLENHSGFSSILFLD